MRTFIDHWYAPAAYANYNLSEGAEVYGQARHYARTASGNTQGVAAVKPFPLDTRGVLVRLEGRQVTITLDGRQYFQGSAAEIAAIIRRQSEDRRQQESCPTKCPGPSQAYEAWLATGEEPWQRYRAQCEHAARAVLLHDASLGLSQESTP